ncbi:nitroreductase family protein [Polycyclovorans algicola]|uniref:nitroreductase family protein n=1 Tax=Polycyclovorans algicola TaxID=616992 RepID=UPI000A016C16|nr:nitroreductase family protein [Polycyclovorans algicola]
MTETRNKPAAPKRPRARPAAKPTKPPAASVKPGRYSEPAPPPIDVEAFRQTVITRRSVRRFTDKAIPPAVLEDCLDMAMLAPNSSNLQPWAFYKVQTPAKKRALVKACLGQNAAKTAAELIVVVARTDTYLANAKLNLSTWPKGKIPKIVNDYYAKLVPLMYTQGPLGALGLVKGVGARVVGQFRPIMRGPFSHAEMKVWAVKSTALAAENLILAFRAHGFDTCAMEGFDEERVSKLLKLPAGAHILMVIGAGERAADGLYYPQVRFDRSRFVFTV